MFSQEIGIDLGTANTLVYKKGKGIILREPSVAAVDTRTGAVRCVGREAREVIGRTPGSIAAVRPLRDGVIADFDVTTAMLQSFIRRAAGRGWLTRPQIVICVPSGVTDVERRAVKESAEKAGARRVAIIEEPMAAAIGAGLPVAEPSGSMVVDIGGGTSEVAVISLGGIVTARSVRIGGNEFDAAIIRYIKRAYQLLIGERTAEAVKIGLGSAYPEEEERTMEIRGRNLLNGLPQNLTVGSGEIREALSAPVAQILGAVRTTLERTPPELAADVIGSGVTLTGGGALLRGLDRLIAQETGMRVNVADDPLDCVARGAGMVLDHAGRLSGVLDQAPGPGGRRI